MNNKIKTELDAIILSSTYKENALNLIEFSTYLCEICEDLKDKYSIKPVIVFEKDEERKFEYIKKSIKERNLDRKIILLLNETSTGFSSCLNYGIDNTYSKYIVRIDTDDKLISERIVNQIDLINSKELDLVTGYMQDQDGNILKYPSNYFSFLLYTFIGTNPIAHPSICIRRSVLNIKYDENLSRCEDFDLWIKLFTQNNLNWECITYPLTLYNTKRSKNKDKSNALNQIKIRIKYSFRFLIAAIILFLGIIPNVIRHLIPNNILLFIRRRI